MKICIANNFIHQLLKIESIASPFKPPKRHFIAPVYLAFPMRSKAISHQPHKETPIKQSSNKHQQYRCDLTWREQLEIRDGDLVIYHTCQIVPVPAAIQFPLSKIDQSANVRGFWHESFCFRFRLPLGMVMECRPSRQLRGQQIACRELIVNRLINAAPSRVQGLLGTEQNRTKKKRADRVRHSLTARDRPLMSRVGPDRNREKDGQVLSNSMARASLRQTPSRAPPRSRHGSSEPRIGSGSLWTCSIDQPTRPLKLTRGWATQVQFFGPHCQPVSRQS